MDTLFKEVIEMGGFGKTQYVCKFRHTGKASGIGSSSNLGMF
jgi:hypothetical protein